MHLLPRRAPALVPEGEVVSDEPEDDPGQVDPMLIGEVGDVLAYDAQSTLPRLSAINRALILEVSRVMGELNPDAPKDEPWLDQVEMFVMLRDSLQLPRAFKITVEAVDPEEMNRDVNILRRKN